jgi:hypothetical protein
MAGIGGTRRYPDVTGKAAAAVRSPCCCHAVLSQLAPCKPVDTTSHTPLISVPYSDHAPALVQEPTKVPQSTSSLPLHLLKQRVQQHGHSNAVLTAQIKATQTWRQAANFFLEFSDQFNHINTCALISHLAKVCLLGLQMDSHDPQVQCIMQWL